MKFTIRDLLLVTMIVALALGWCVDRSRLAKEINALEVKQVADEILVELSRVEPCLPTLPHPPQIRPNRDP